MKPPMLFGRPMEQVQVGAGSAATTYWQAWFGAWTASIGAGNGEWRYSGRLAYSRSVLEDYDGANAVSAADLECWMLRELKRTAKALGFEVRRARP